tara:strand:- start:3085 stop:4731 length:1647 start_codon:yes stop_codon:yes gene_type:complete
MRARSSLPAEQLSSLVPLGLLEGSRGVPFLLTAREAQAHALVLGKTGCGKTTWALTYARALAERGTSIACVSPHPDLDHGFLQIAAELGLPCVHIDFGGRSSLVTPFSFLSVEGVRPDEVAHLAQSLFAATFGSGGAAGTIRSTLGPLFFVLASFPDELTLLDADRLVHDPAFAKRFVDRLDSPLPQVVSFFAALASKTKGSALQSTRFALARIHALLAYRGVRLTLCGRPTVNLRTVIRTPTVIVVSIPAATLGDTAGLLAGLVVEHLRLILMQRTVPCSEPPFALFIDELGSLVAGASRLGAFLAEARKFKASLVGLTQSMTQLESNKRLHDAFMTNTNMLVLGRLGPHDANRFSGLPAPSSQAETFKHDGLWVEGIDATWGNPAEPERRQRHATQLARALQDCPPRRFHVYASLKGNACTARVRAFNLEANSRGAPQLLGALPVARIERALANAPSSPAPAPAVPQILLTPPTQAPRAPSPAPLVITPTSRRPSTRKQPTSPPAPARSPEPAAPPDPLPSEAAAPPPPPGATKSPMKPGDSVSRF